MSETIDNHHTDKVEDILEKPETQRLISDQGKTAPATVAEQILFLLNIGVSKANEIWSKEDWQHKLLIVQFILFIFNVSVASLLWLRAKPALIKFAKFKSEQCLSKLKLKSE